MKLNWNQAISAFVLGMAGRIAPSVRGVSLRVEENSLKLVYYFDTTVCDEDEEQIRITPTEAFSHFPHIEQSYSEEVFIKEEPLHQLSDNIGVWLYLRKGG